MAKRYKRKKLKRYRRSYYTPAMRVRRMVSIVALVLAVLAVAWFAAPHVLDWATHTWYTVVRDRDFEAESAAAASASEAAASEAAASSAASAERAASSEKERIAAQAEPERTGAEIVAGSWVYIERSSLTDEAAITAAAEQAAARGAKYALVTLKDSAGSVYYASSVAATADSMADELVEPELIASIFKANGLIPVAQVAAFRDPIAPYTDRSLAIHYRSGGEGDYLWLDAANAAAGGKPWINPYSTAAVEYVGDIVAELHSAGFDHVALSCVQFPSSVSSKQDFGSTGGVSRFAQLAADIAAWKTRFGSAVTLWYRYSYSDCTGTPSALGASALELGAENMLIEVPKDSTLDETARAEFVQTASAAGAAHVVIRDEAAGYFE